jgi:hypothetical protein
MSATTNPDPLADPIPDPSADRHSDPSSDPHQPQASPGIERPSALALQATLVDFALGELVRQQRQSFQPLWTRESWAKLLIWLALNCGCGTDTASLEAFAAAIGPSQLARLRRQFFERQLEDLNLLVLADPAEQQVLVWPLGPGLDAASLAAELAQEQVAAALERVGLLDQVTADRGRWQSLEALVAVPWSQPCS